MQMGHQPPFVCDSLHQGVIGLDRIDGRYPQPRQIRHQLQDASDEVTQPRSARKVCAPGRQVDTGQHDFVEAPIHQPGNLVNHHTRRNRARVSASIGDDAKRAAMIAPVLNLHIGPVPAETVDQVACGLGHAHDVVHQNGLGHTDGRLGPDLGLHFLGIADDQINLRHRCEPVRIGLGGASRDDNTR